MAAAAAVAGAGGVGHVVERFRARLREEQEEEEGGGGEVAAAAVVRVYVEVLSELTFNCKPIITELTIIAGQHAALAARGIADAICARIAEVSADQKLPSLYLLDSIVKNIGREYVGHFAARLQKVFCDAYRKVHRNQHAAMRHLFGTWSQVFPSSVLRGIEDELQFSPLENKRSATATDIRQSESISPRLSHAIHVNPKYLEAQQQFKQSTSVHQPITRGNRQMNDVEEDQINGLTSKSSRGWPATNSKLQSTMLYADDLDQQEAFCSHTGLIRPSSPHLLSKHPSILNTEGPLANSRRTMSRSPPLDVLPRNASPKRALERPPLSHSVLGPDPRRLPDRNGWFERKWAFEDGAQRPSMSILDEEYRKQSARELIDAYGNSQGKDVDERLPKMQRLDSNGMAGRPSAQKWLTSEEEEYTWEDMSPTLTDRNRTSVPSLPPLGTLRAGFLGPNSGLLESDIVRHSWPGQAPRPAIDGPPLNLEDRIPTNGPVDRTNNRRYPGNFGVQNGAFLDYQSSEHTLDPGRTTMPVPPWQQTIGQPLRVQAPQPASILNRMPLPTDSEVPVKRLATGGTYDALNVDIPLLEKQRSSPAHAPMEWPLNTQSLTIQPIPPDTKHPRGASDGLDSRPFISQGSSSSVFVPQHHALDRRTMNADDLAQPSYQHPDLLSLSQQNQGTVLGNQGQPHHPPQFHPHPHSHLQETIRSFAPSMSVAPPQNIFHGQGGSAAALLPSSFPVPPAVPPYGLQSMPGFPLPSLPSGPPPPSQIGPSSSQVGGPPLVSGLLSNLMQHGIISLQPPSQPQDSVGVDFNVDLKVRNESVINALYQDLPRQCKTCGLRFKCQEEHRAHMDWHVTKNRNSKNRKQTSRKYFVTVGEWLRAAETVGNDGVPSFEPAEPVADAKEEKELAVPADEDQTTCALCQEPFEDFYSDETEEWMYKGAVYMNAPDGNIGGLERSQLGPIVHAKCLSGPNNT
ncbi:polyadenylation and cleavage factor homolog 4 isoform X1 [Oryza sativa Japonica Group]|uniref:polyadenylation and cleavage factor homolog 4 isoform X1 n=1 Tax=Oryza sativa subsp. japonica TaxID=39947 RepID=UPI0007753E51|nr:polyadenylation and cleavage factor homolog 4 isoform X2 [Oryza sativa Japonica Group]